MCLQCCHRVHLSLLEACLLNWYQMVCMGDLSHAFIRMKSTNIFFMYLQSGLSRHFHWEAFSLKIYCGFNKEPYSLYMCVYERCTQTLAEICRHVVFVMFSCHCRQEKYVRVFFYWVPRDYSLYAPGQWETLHCNAVSHWLGAYTKWSLGTLICIQMPCQMGLGPPVH